MADEKTEEIQIRSRFDYRPRGRLFGQPPIRDIRNLRSHGAPGLESVTAA